MKNLAEAAVIIGILLICSRAESSEMDKACRPIDIFFGNGVNTEVAAAHDTVRNIRRWIDPATMRTIDGYPVKFNTAYNPTKNILLDLLEAYSQKMAEDPTMTWSHFFRFLTGHFVTAAMAVYLDNYYNNLGARKYSQLASDLASPPLYTDPTVLTHVQLYRDAMLKGHRIVVVAHSQGALYANAAHTYLRTTDSAGIDLGAFAIAAVASPANSVVTGEGHLTSATDLVIQGVRAFTRFTLPPNDSSVGIFPPEDRWGHSFDNIYFNPKYPIRQKTEALVLASLARIKVARSTAPTSTNLDAVASTTTRNGTPLTDQFVAKGMIFEGLTVFRNDGDPNNPNNQRFIPKLPGRIGYAVDTTGRGKIRISPAYRVHTVTVDHRSASGFGIGVTTRLGHSYGIPISASPFGLLGAGTTILPTFLIDTCAEQDSIETVEFERMNGDTYIIDRVQIN